MSLSWLRSLVVFLGVFSLFASPSLTLADPSGLAADIENARASLQLEGEKHQVELYQRFQADGLHRNLLSS